MASITEIKNTVPKITTTCPFDLNETFTTTKGSMTMMEIVNHCHRAMSIKMGWSSPTVSESTINRTGEKKYVPITPGQFGFDNFVSSVGFVLTSDYFSVDKKRFPELSDVASLVHNGWAANYVRWRDEKPWEHNSSMKKPYTPLGDENRDKLAVTPFKNLSKEEQDKDIIVAECLLELFGIEHIVYTYSVEPEIVEVTGTTNVARVGLKVITKDSRTIVPP